MDMNINLNKRKQGARWSVADRVPGIRLAERSGPRLSVLANQKVQRRIRHRELESHVETSRPERTHPPVRETLKKRPVFFYPIGVRLLEGGVVLAAGLSLIVKNGISQIAGWIREGKEKVTGSDANVHGFNDEWEGEENEEGIWDGDDGEKTIGSAAEFSWDRTKPSTPQVASQDCSVLSDASIREDVELNKVHMLDVEEDGLPEEELVDQAGALRARLSDSVRHT